MATKDRTTNMVTSELATIRLGNPAGMEFLGGDFAVAKHTPHNVRASLETSGGDLNRDLVLAYQLSRPQSGVDWVASKEPGEDGYVFITLTAGEELGDANSGMDYVFILDISGSMNDA